MHVKNLRKLATGLSRPVYGVSASATEPAEPIFNELDRELARRANTSHPRSNLITVFCESSTMSESCGNPVSEAGETLMPSVLLRSLPREYVKGSHRKTQIRCTKDLRQM